VSFKGTGRAVVESGTILPTIEPLLLLVEKPLLFTLAVVFFLLAGAAVSSAQENSSQVPRPKPAPPPPQDSSSPSPLEGLSIEFAPEIETGLYGTKFRSTFIYLPLTLGYDFDRVSTSVTIPYISEATHGNTVIVGGRVVRVSKTGAKKTKRESGLGDIEADLGYTLIRQDRQRSLPSLSFDAEVKFPTADDERGLGTGSYDETFWVRSGVTFFNHLKASLGAGYGIIGQPEDLTTPKFHDTIYWTGGIGWDFDRKNDVWLRNDGNTAIVKHQPPYSVLSAEYGHWFGDSSKFFISIGLGLTSASPGLSVIAGYTYFF
jgi:hypothetical protein